MAGKKRREGKDPREAPQAQAPTKGRLPPELDKRRRPRPPYLAICRMPDCGRKGGGPFQSFMCPEHNKSLSPEQKAEAHAAWKARHGQAAPLVLQTRTLQQQRKLLSLDDDGPLKDLPKPPSKPRR